MASLMRIRAICLVLLLTMASATASSEEISGTETIDCALIEQLSFNGTNANESVSHQVSLGPRVPGSTASSALRQSIKENLSGWTISESTHHLSGITLTNLFATWNPGAGNTVFLAAHYDTRALAERDSNESMRDQPIPGANDGASGVAVLMELARSIPSMGLDHEVTLFFTDAEDFGESASLLGARAWAENLSDEDADAIESFILVDMVGDAFLNLAPSTQGNETLWVRMSEINDALGYSSSNSCSETQGVGVFSTNTSYGVWDDHVWPISRGIPSIDIIDIAYGENVSNWEGHWHTHEDTPDKVSAESLEMVGKMVELGLRSGLFLDVRVSTLVDDENPIPDGNEDSEVVSDNNEITIGVMIMACLLLIWAIIVWVYLADRSGEG